MPPRGQRPPVPPGPPPSATEQTQLIPPIRSDVPPLAPEELTVPIPRIPARPRLDEQETELIPRIDDYDQYQDLDEPEPEPEPETPAGAVEVPEPRRETGRVVVRTFGELLITAGLVVLLFVVYEVYVTDWLSAGKQANATSAMDDRWKNPSVVNNNEPQRTNQFEVGDGEGFAKVYIPAFGPDYVYTVLEGTTDQILEVGPGHYKGTAYPGQPGNFAVAGHRVGKGAPFNDIDLLESCDAILVETQTDWFVYRMLPKTDEVKDWAKGKGADGKCKGVAPQGKGGKDDPYAKTVGQEIVRPEQGEVIAPVPWRANNAVPKDKQAKLITLTTCHPRFSARQRLIVHGVLVRTQPKDPKDPKAVPAEFQTG
ncbi:class E sortase [Crossiella sp. NPDC003009]